MTRPLEGSPRVFRFGRHAVVLSRRELLEDGVPVELGGRAFDLLLALIEGKGKVLNNEQLMNRVWPGQPYPLGATWDGEGVNFALFSENATGVDLCLFDHADDAIELRAFDDAGGEDEVVVLAGGELGDVYIFKFCELPAG